VFIVLVDLFLHPVITSIFYFENIKFNKMGVCGAKKNNKNANIIYVNLKDGMLVTDDKFPI
jgi:hypothetical protein